MRKVILNLAVTFDGFIEGPNKEIDWIHRHDDGTETANVLTKFLSGIDIIFYGRVSYDMWGQSQPDEHTPGSFVPVMNAINSKKKIVFSKHPRKDDKATFISSAIRKNVEQIKNEPGKDIWLYGGSKLITTFINEGLVDTFYLAVFPVLLGKGTPLFKDIQQEVDLELVSVESSSGIMLVRYDVKK